MLPQNLKPKEVGMVMLMGCRCRCGHEWLPHKDVDTIMGPMKCPKCKSPVWDRPYERSRNVNVSAR